MGYRSDVYLKTTQKGFDLLREYNDCLPLATQFLGRGTNGLRPTILVRTTLVPVYKIVYHDVEWYEYYDDVQAFHNALGILNYNRVPYKLIRLGEDITDVQVLENPYLDYNSEEVPCSIADFNVIRDVDDPDSSASYNIYNNIYNNTTDSCSLSESIQTEQEDNQKAAQEDALDMIYKINNKKGDDKDGNHTPPDIFND